MGRLDTSSGDTNTNEAVLPGLGNRFQVTKIIIGETRFGTIFATCLAKSLTMTNKITLTIFILVFSLSGCERIDLNKPVYSKVGEKYKVDYNLSFSIDSIDDYRCPLLFECIWSGDVKMLCTFYEPRHNTDTAIYLLNTQNSISIGGYNFKLLSVNPQSQKGELIPQNEYKLEIMVQKN